MERVIKMKKYVMDSSVVIKWFSEHDEDDLEKALNLRYEILEGICSIIVPDLLFYEITNALRYNPRFKADDVIEAFKTISEMGFEVRNINSDMMAEAIKIAFKNTVSVYDAYFLALSQIEKIPFVTADYRFIKHFKNMENIIKLSDI